jgi:4-alpha-glucanotransferase
MQDIMRLDNSARMNTPGKAAGNWAWRVGSSDIWEQLQQEASELKRLTYIYDRLPKDVEVEY